MTSPSRSPSPPLDLTGLHRRVLSWFEEHRRDLPWRAADRTPWGVMVSEFMLQQTPVARVLPRWTEWMERWPTVQDFAAASQADAVRAWDRLGYPRRALRLHAAAVEITRRGHFPSTHAELIALPGVGDYTAGAVSAFAFGNRETVVDTNIRRVQARAVTGTALPRPALTAAERRLATELLPVDDIESVAWNYGVMELGAVVCTAKRPDCHRCPLLDVCRWVADGRPEPDYQPKGQSWVGSDRRVRGAVMAVLRHGTRPVPRPVVDSTEVDVRWVGDPAATPWLAKLAALDAPADQRIRAVEGLLADGLAVEHDDGLALPG